MLYPELFKQLESVRWDMDKDIPWDSFDASKLSDEQAQTIKMNAITEWAALPATEMFLRDNRDDSDFSAFMSIWFFEEQKHSLVLMEYLRRFRPDLVPTEEELHDIRFEFDPAPALETLMLHFCGEIRLNHWYRRASEWHSEPVIKQIYSTLSQDEARHGGAYLRYMKRAIGKFGNEARTAFTKVGVLMASARRTAQALHPTNLHVNKALFPHDTIQSRLPNPEWLEHWLDKQINFDAVWESKVVERILHNMSLLMNQSFKSVQELNRYRKELGKEISAAAQNGRTGPSAKVLPCPSCCLRQGSWPKSLRVSSSPRGCCHWRARWSSPMASLTSCTGAMPATWPRPGPWAPACWWPSIPTHLRAAWARGRTVRSMPNRTGRPLSLLSGRSTW